LEFDWAMIDRVQVLMLHRIIKCRRSILQAIMAEFVASPFNIEAIFGLVSLLQQV
jgi:hypothetical protein